MISAPEKLTSGNLRRVLFLAIPAAAVVSAVVWLAPTEATMGNVQRISTSTYRPPGSACSVCW